MHVPFGAIGEVEVQFSDATEKAGSPVVAAFVTVSGALPVLVTVMSCVRCCPSRCTCQS